MNMAEQDQDKTEQATPFKLREAKKKGQLAKSMEMNSFLVLSAVLLMSYMVGYQILQEFLRINSNILNLAGQVVFSERPLMLLYETVIQALLITFWAVIAAVVVISIIGNMVQIGPVFTLHPIKPDIQRINPISGFKRIFSMKMVFEFIKTIVKITIFVLIVHFSIKALIPELLNLIDINVKSYGYLLLAYSNSLYAKLLAAVFFIAIIDFAFTKRDYSKKMMMSRREVKDEVKRREGDPRVKSKLRELQREAAKRAGSINQVSDADVLITNPTHLAIAVSYKRDYMRAPTVLAKGAGDMAEKMKILARKYNVPIFEDKPLARELFRKTGIDNPIPEDCYKSVAKLLVIAYRLKKKSGLA